MLLSREATSTHFILGEQQWVNTWTKHSTEKLKTSVMLIFTSGLCYRDMLSFFKIYLFIYFLLCWVFVSVRGLSPVAASGGHSSSRCAGLSLSRPLLLRSTGSRRAGSVVVAHEPSRSAARGILPDQGPNPCPLHWQADSPPLRHQGRPRHAFFLVSLYLLTSICEESHL